MSKQLSEHDKELLKKIERLDEHWSNWPAIMHLASQEGDGFFSVRDDFFPEITWENSPVKFSLTKEEEQQ
jgi:hypothetical protein